MKLLGLATATVITVIPSAARAEWVYVTSTQDGEAILAVEDSSINNQGSTVTFWQQDLWKIPYKGQVKRIITHYALDCSTQETRVINSTAYNNKGNPLNKLAYPTGAVTTFPPGTAGYTVGQMVCGN